MSLAGKLEELRLPELLQVLALGGKSGKLALTRSDAFGLIVLRRGKVIYAVCNGVRETFGHILVCRGLVDEKTLSKALEKQFRSRSEQRLGTVLVEMGALTAANVEAVICEQVARVIAELCTWPGGFFRFDAVDIPDRGEVEVDARDFLMSDGVDGEQVAIDVLAHFGVDGAGDQRGAGTAEALRGRGAGARREPGLAAILDGVRTPAFVGEYTHTFLRDAARLVNRGVVFAVRRNELIGMGQFGLGGDAEPPDSRVRRLAVPLREPSVLAIAAGTREVYRGPLEDTPWNRRLWQQLGGGRAPEVVAVPILAHGEVVAVFYGDNAPAGGRLAGTRDLELLALAAGTHLERAFHTRAPSHPA